MSELASLDPFLPHGLGHYEIVTVGLVDNGQGEPHVKLEARLEEVTIDVKVDITSEESSAILSTVMEGESRLRSLILHEIDVADLVEVDQGLIKRATEKIGFSFSVYDDCGSEEDFSEDCDDIIVDIKLLF